MNSIDNQIGSRIEELVQLLAERSKEPMNKGIFAASIQINASQFSRILKGEMLPTLTQLINISNKYGVSINWLATGRGEVFEKEKSGQKKPDFDMIIHVKQSELEKIKASFYKLFSGAEMSHSLNNVLNNQQAFEDLPDIAREEKKQGYNGQT